MSSSSLRSQAPSGLYCGNVVSSGIVSAEGLSITSVNRPLDAPSIGSANLGSGGNITLSTLACDPSSKIFITPTSPGSGSLSVGAVGTGAFMVSSSAGFADAGRTFNWWIVNPVY